MHLQPIGTDCGKRPEPRNENFPRSTVVRYKFLARGQWPAVSLTWLDGGIMPPWPAILELTSSPAERSR